MTITETTTQSTATGKAAVLLMSNEAQAKVIDSIKAKLSGHRKIFESGEDALKTLAEIGGLDGMTLPIIVSGHGDVNTLEEAPAWTTGRVGISLLGVKREKTSGARAVVLYPCPTVEDYDSDPVGHDWLDKITIKETSHVAFRALRAVPDTSESLAELIQAAVRMPVSVGEYAEAHRAAGGIDLDAFNEVWPFFRGKLVKEFPTLKSALPAKGEVINAIRSKSYAEREYPDLESQSLFTFVGNSLIQLCAGLKDEKTGEPTPVDASEIEDWLAGRDTLTIEPKERVALTTTLDLTQFRL